MSTISENNNNTNALFLDRTGVATNSNTSTYATTAFFPKNSVNYPIKKISEFEFVVEKDKGAEMKVPVRIYANETLLSGMVADRTIGQAINVSTLPGVRKHVIILPD